MRQLLGHEKEEQNIVMEKKIFRELNSEFDDVFASDN